MLRAIGRILKGLGMCLGIAICAVIALYHYCSHNLPNHAFLQNYRPPEGSRIYANDHQVYRELISEYRIFVPIHEIPPQLIKAFLAAEDKNFYYHPGIDLFSLAHAIIRNTLHGKWYAKPVGASTITQQVAKNFLVGNDQSFIRKVREAIMSMRIERELSKDRILELYLNQIYLGMRSYGVAAAAYTYFQKSLHELTLVECAFLASLPKAPANYHPIKEQKKAILRRNATLKRLAEEKDITYESAQVAQNEPLNVSLHGRLSQFTYPSEEIRRELVQRFKDGAVYQEGYSIYTSLDTPVQAMCEKALRSGLEAYDKRHGYRGPLFKMTRDEMQNWSQTLCEKMSVLTAFPKDRKQDIAVVLEVLPNLVEIGFSDGRKGKILDAQFQKTDFAKPKTPSAKKWIQLKSVLHEGDVIVTRPVDRSNVYSHTYLLDQIPEVTGAMVVLDANTGEIIAMSGGYSMDISQFNCATQAIRQPGSSFKPFVYLSALELGYTRDTIIDDSPIEVVLGAGLGVYAPKNSTRKSLGPTPLYVGIEQSVNQMTVRLAHQIGMAPIQNMAKRLGISDNMPSQLAMSLGAGGTTVLKMTAAYATIVNGGKRVFPHFVRRINNREGQLIFQMPPAFNDHLYDARHGTFTDERVQAIDPQYAAEIQEMLRGVVKRGNAKSLNYLREQHALDLGGKTGTTNDYKDAWFIGFVRFPSNKMWIVGTFVGFSKPKSLGKGEGGGRVAVPIFQSFLLDAIKLNNIKKTSVKFS